MFAVFAAVFVVYLLTAPHVITFEDAPLFNINCYFGQPSHPPGYPLYSLLCYPFAHLPFVSSVIGGNLLSALFAAAACAVLYLIAVELTGHAVYGYLAALAYGFSKVFWSQAIIQEVYAMHTFLFLLMFLQALLYARGANPLHLKRLAVVFGLGIATHWPLTLLAAPALLVLLAPASQKLAAFARKLKNLAGLAGLFAAAALLPYLYLLTTNLPSPVNFNGPLDSFDKLFAYVARASYADVDNQMVSWFDKAMYAKFLLQQTGAQYGAVFLPFAAAGFFLQWRRWHWSVCWSLIGVYLSATFVLVLFLNFGYNALFEGVFSVYPIVAYSVLALWGVLAVEWLAGHLQRAWPHAVRESIRRMRLPAVLLTTILVPSVTWSNWEANDRSHDRFAFDYARTILESFEENSVVLLHNDFQMPLIQLNLVEGVRGDVTLYDIKGLLLANRYLIPPTGHIETQDRSAAFFVKHTHKPIYYFRDFEHGYGVEDFGLYRKVRKDWPDGRREQTALPQLFELWDSAEGDVHDTPFDAWVKRGVRSSLAQLVMEAQDIDATLQHTYQKRMGSGSYYDLMGLIDYITAKGGRLIGLIEKAEERAPAGVAAKDRATLLYARALASIPAGGTTAPAALNQFIGQLQQAVAAYPSSDNPAVRRLLQAYAQMNARSEFASLHERYPAAGANDAVVQAFAKQIGGG